MTYRSTRFTPVDKVVLVVIDDPRRLEVQRSTLVSNNKRVVIEVVPGTTRVTTNLEEHES